ncbi:MAG: hypothetical protein WAR37_04900 [Candidatus Microsaccharimonas sp.]
MDQQLDTQAEPAKKKIPSRTKKALILILAPTLMIIISFICFALINLVFNQTFWMKPDGEPVAETLLFVTILNIIFFTIGVVGIISWLPGIVIGGILLAKKPSSVK